MNSFHFYGKKIQVEGLEVVWKEPKVVASPLVFDATREQILAEMEASNRD